MSVTDLVHRGWTIGEDLADTASATVGYARSLNDDPTSGNVLRQAGLVAAAATDGLLLATFRQLRAPTSDEAFAARLGEAQELVSWLDDAGVLADPASFHVAPDAAVIEAIARRVGRTHFGHATYPSPYQPDPAVPGATRFAELTDNHTVHAWMLRQSVRAPWVVCLHGAGMGDPLADFVAFRAAWLHRCGFNVAIPVLPHHGPRGTNRFVVAFPSDDPTMNFHGAVQAIADVRALVAYCRAQHEQVVLFGISLGGYVTGAVTALEPDLAGAIAGVPVVDIAELLRTHAPPRFAKQASFQAFCDLAARLDRTTSALGLPAPTNPDQPRRIWAGRADRLVRPSQVVQLVDRWGHPEVCWYAGGHMGFIASRRVHATVVQTLVDAGVGVVQHGRFRALAS